MLARDLFVAAVTSVLDLSQLISEEKEIHRAVPWQASGWPLSESTIRLLLFTGTLNLWTFISLRGYPKEGGIMQFWWIVSECEQMLSQQLHLGEFRFNLYKTRAANTEKFGLVGGQLAACSRAIVEWSRRLPCVYLFLLKRMIYHNLHYHCGCLAEGVCLCVLDVGFSCYPNSGSTLFPHAIDTEVIWPVWVGRYTSIFTFPGILHYKFARNMLERSQTLKIKLLTVLPFCRFF